MQESTTLSPYMFVSPFTKDHFSKTTQWVSLTRAAATVAVHDRVVEAWFATFGGSRWRCVFLSEARVLLPEVARLAARGVQIPDRNAALQLKRHGALPANFSQGELLEGILPGTPGAPPARGVGLRGGFTGGLTAALAGWGGGRRADPELTAAQRDAVEAYRRELRLRPPSWAYLPFDTPREQLVGAGAGVEDSPEAIAAREAIWNSLLGTQSAARDLRGAAVSGPRARGGSRELLQGDLVRLSKEEREETSKEEARRQDILKSHDNLSQYVNGRLEQVTSVIAAGAPQLPPVTPVAHSRHRAQLESRSHWRRRSPPHASPAQLTAGRHRWLSRGVPLCRGQRVTGRGGRPDDPHREAASRLGCFREPVRHQCARVQPTVAAALLRRRLRRRRADDPVAAVE